VLHAAIDFCRSGGSAQTRRPGTYDRQMKVNGRRAHADPTKFKLVSANFMFFSSSHSLETALIHNETRADLDA
jgi:hypothetical protein